MSMSNNTRNHQDPKFHRSKRRSKLDGVGDPTAPAPSQPPTTAATAAASSSSSTSMPTTTPAASPFQNIFDNVCRCFGHVPASSPTTSFPPPPGSNTAAAAAAAVSSGSSSSQQQQQQQNGQLQDEQQQQPTRTTPSSRETKKRTERLELRGREYDELFTGKDENGGTRRKNHPPRPEQLDPYSTKSGRSRGRGGSSRSGDVEIAHAVAQAKLAANPPRYGGSNHNNRTYRHSSSKRKRSPTQIRDDIFRNMNSMKNNAVTDNEQQQSSVRTEEGATNNGTNRRGGKSTTGVGGIPQPDFSRLLNPSLALCFATPIRGTEEEDEAASDVKSLGSDTNTLNTNGDDTITSTLYFDSKYAHIHETRPPMPLFNQFKVGMESDEIRNIVATDSHSSMKMMKLLQEQEQEQQRRDAAASTQDADDHAMSDNEEISTASKRSNADSNSSSNGRKGSRNIHDDPATVSTRLDPRASDGRIHQPQPNHRHIQSMSTIVQSNQRYPLNNSGSDSRTKSHRLQHNPHGPSTTATTTSDSGYDDGDVDMT